MPPLPIFPEQASDFASSVDGLYMFLVALSVLFGLGIAGALALFAVKYRRRSATDRPELIHGSLALELAWSVGPLGIVTVRCRSCALRSRRGDQTTSAKMRGGTAGGSAAMVQAPPASEAASNSRAESL